MTIIDQLIPLADAHRDHDEYVKGSYWIASTKRGCSVGCAIADLKKLGVLNGVEYGDHAALAKATKVPEMLWRLSDNIFEGLPSDDSPAWTPRFLRSVKEARDLDNAPARIMARLADRLATDAIRDDVRAVCQKVAVLWRRRASGDEPDKSDWDAARKQADAAWEQADAAWEQADAAWKQAYAAWKQADAAWKQADAAWKQADAARKQADAAWEQADAAREQADAAREQWWKWCADVVCEEIVAS